MAVDEALLEAFVADPEAAPVLRVYGWSPAGFSLGRFQPADDLAALAQDPQPPTVGAGPDVDGGDDRG